MRLCVHVIPVCSVDVPAVRGVISVFVPSVKTQIFGAFPWYLQEKYGEYLKMNYVLNHKIPYYIDTSFEFLCTLYKYSLIATMS